MEVEAEVEEGMAGNRAGTERGKGEATTLAALPVGELLATMLVEGEVVVAIMQVEVELAAVASTEEVQQEALAMVELLDITSSVQSLQAQWLQCTPDMVGEVGEEAEAIKWRGSTGLLIISSKVITTTTNNNNSSTTSTTGRRAAALARD